MLSSIKLTALLLPHAAVTADRHDVTGYSDKKGILSSVGCLEATSDLRPTILVEGDDRTRGTAVVMQPDDAKIWATDAGRSQTSVTETKVLLFDNNGTLLDKGIMVLGVDMTVKGTGLIVVPNGEITVVDSGAGITMFGLHEITELVTDLGISREEPTVPDTELIIPATLDTLLDTVSVLVIIVGTELMAFDIYVTVVDTEVTAQETDIEGLDNDAAILDTEIAEFSVIDRAAGIPGTLAVVLGRVVTASGNTVADSRLLDIVVMVLVTELESKIIAVDVEVAKQLETEVIVLCTAVKMVAIDATEDREITAITAKSPRCSKGINWSN